MEFEKACRILGIKDGDSLDDIKRKYHKLAAKIHPDVSIYKKAAGTWQIAEVNAAYEFLVKQGGYQKYIQSLSEKKKSSEKKQKWDAPINSGAYVEREIYQYAEDQDGIPIGIYKAAEGKYFWNHEAEDFNLFLKSIISAADHLIEELEEKQNTIIQENLKFEAKKELIYLLAGQYTDMETGLQIFAQKELQDKNGMYIYYLTSMLEVDSTYNWKKQSASVRERLYPLKLKNHRLYIGKKEGEILGYLSFPDDRLYYVLIPMFENREVQVKIEVAEEMKRNRKGKAFLPLHLWIKRVGKEYGIQENVNCKIEKILKNLI